MNININTLFLLVVVIIITMVLLIIEEILQYREAQNNKKKLERYRKAMIKGRRHNPNCYGEPEFGCICGLEKELEEGKK